MMIEIKGRTPFSESNKYLRQVRDRSTTRGLTVALATPSTGQDFRNAHSMQRAYKEKERAGLAKGRADGEAWELYLVPRGKLADRLLDELTGAGAREKMPAKDGTMLWVMVHPKGAAGARAGAPSRARTRADPDARAPAPVDVHPRGVFRRGAVERIPPPAVFVPLPPPGTTAVPPPPPRSAADEFLSQLSAPPGPASAPTTTFEVPPPPRVAVVPPPPPRATRASPTRPPPALPRHPGDGPAP